ncbi:MAG: fasciclin domain-containing protein [Flavobacterium sp.]|nr:fasciclin domain-containing protein [Pedobacter sp.]
MKKSIFVLSASVLSIVTIASSQAQQKPETKTTGIESTIIKKDSNQDTIKNPAQAKTVGGAQMLPTNDIVQNASQSKNLTTLVTAIQGAGLVDSLKAAGPFTVFAPTNEAFTKLPEGILDNLKKPDNKEKLAEVVSNHIVAGKFTSRDLALAVARSNGNATLTTVEGDKILVSINAEKNLQITDSKGNIALVTMFDVEQSNGIVHVINNVLLPQE